ncbi:palmitoyltransferase ZDHHC22-like [Bacillus rossius redtenbacheri]|uniref:palmitoyltransferase ZDHHC22-like n=1 Tax=Bacillus rossius redtenbacheri TaxID=93214 RepID=UPI002FDEA268
MNKCVKVIFAGLPFLTFVFTLWVVYVIAAGVHNLNVHFLILIFALFEVYLNWIAILLANKNISKRVKQDIYRNVDQMAPVELESNSKKMLNGQDVCISLTDSNSIECSPLPPLKSGVNLQKMWFCPKCQLTSPQNCYHCPLCRKCIILRDHHCFFLGACISKQNLSHFIVLCLYASVVSFSASVIVHSQLKVIFQNTLSQPQLWVMVRYFFPVSLGHWLSGAVSFHTLSLVSVFDLCVSLSVSTLCFGLYYIHLVATGKMEQKLNSRVFFGTPRLIHGNNFARNLTNVFGDCGIVNLFFPVAAFSQFFSLKKLRLPILCNDYKFH